MPANTASRFAIGKLPIKTLERFRQNRISDRRVVVGPGIGEDAEVIDTGGPRCLYCHRFRQCLTRDQGEIPCLDGESVKGTIPPGTQSGHELRLCGKGMPLLHAKGKGDLYVEVTISLARGGTV